MSQHHKSQIVLMLIYLLGACTPTNKSTKIFKNDPKLDLIIELSSNIDCYLLEAIEMDDSNNLYIYNYDSNIIEKYTSGVLSKRFQIENNKTKIYSLSIIDNQIYILFDDNLEMLILNSSLEIIESIKLNWIEINNSKFRPLALSPASKIIGLENDNLLVPIETFDFNKYASNLEDRKKKFSFPSDLIYNKKESLNDSNIKLTGFYTSDFIEKFSNEVFPFRTLYDKEGLVLISFKSNNKIYLYDCFKDSVLQSHTIETNIFGKKNIAIDIFDSSQAEDYSYYYNYDIINPKYVEHFTLDKSNIIYRVFISRQSLVDGSKINNYFDREFSIIAYNIYDSTRIGEQVFQGSSFRFNSIIKGRDGFYLMNRLKCSEKRLYYTYFYL